MTVSLWQPVTDPIHAEHDDVVIGAGIVGSYAAWILQQRGRDVALVDARHPAAGASGRNGGFVMTSQRESYPVLVEQVGHDAARHLLDMVCDNVTRMRRIATQFNVPFDDGAVHLAETQAEARELEQWARLFERDGVTLEYTERDPYGAGFASTMRVKDDFVVQPARLTEAIATASQATLYDQNEVHAIRRDGNQLAVLGRRAHLRCERVYVATNGYTGHLHPYLAPLIQPVRGQILLTRPLPPLLEVAGLTEYHYFRQFTDGRVLIGGSRCFFEAQEYTAEDMITMNLQKSLESYLSRWFGVAFDVERRWAGIHGFTPDRRAAIGKVPQEPNIAFVLGFSGYGNSIGLVSAERMVELAMDGRDPGPLNADRFGQTG